MSETPTWPCPFCAGGGERLPGLACAPCNGEGHMSRFMAMPGPSFGPLPATKQGFSSGFRLEKIEDGRVRWAEDDA